MWLGKRFIASIKAMNFFSRVHQTTVVSGKWSGKW